MIFGLPERFIAWRYLRARRQEGFISVISWFSLLGIALGVATLIVVMSVMNGFRAELIGRVLGMNGHMNVYANQGPLFDYEGILDSLHKVEGVRDVSAVIEGQTLITRNGVASGAMVRGVNPVLFAKKDLVAGHLVEGDLAKFQDDQVVIGVRMARRLGVHAGDTLTLLAPSGKTTVFGTAPRMRSFSIAAIFDVGMFEYDNGFVFMSLYSAQNFFKMETGISTLELTVANLGQLDDVKENVAAALGETDLRLYDWRQSNSSFFTALQVERNVMFLILTLIILVAAFNIISGLIMLVKDKGHDIAILRTMGATRGAIMRIFFLTGSSIGVMGTMAGLGLGILIASNIENVRQVLQTATNTDLFSAEIYFLTHLPSKIDAGEVVQVVAMALGLSFLATLYPSWRAARLDPVEALRYE